MKNTTGSETTISEIWRIALNTAVHDSKLPLLYQQDVGREASARVVVALLKAFGESASGFVYIEPNVARSTVKPPDILLAHHDVGVCIFELRTWPISIVQGIEASRLNLREDGFIKGHDVFNEAAAAMFQIKEATRRMAGRAFRDGADSYLPAFNFFVVFPNIRRTEWTAPDRRYDQCLKIEQLVFAEDLEQPQLLRALTEKYVRVKAKNREPLTAEHLTLLQRAIGDAAVLNDSRSLRPEVEPNKIGYDIDRVALEDKDLSAEQKELSRADFAGHPQLIRGVAGSGKSIVLANNAANYLIRKLATDQQQQLPFDQPAPKSEPPRIGIVCFNRTLVSFLRQKVRTAFEQRRLSKPPNKTIDCNYFNGFLYTLCKENHWLEYQRVNEDNPESGAQAARGYLRQLRQLEQQMPQCYQALLFDAIYVDEAQDFHGEEFQLLLSLMKPHSKTGEKSIVIFYDDAQNLYARPRPTWSQIGINVVGGGRSRVMKECFRNSREIVEFAFNVLLGSKAPAELRIQTREYADVTYLRENGMVEELPDRWKVNFTERTYNRPPEVRQFKSRQDEKIWVAETIRWLVENQHVRPEDILVLFQQSLEFADLDQLVRARVPSIQEFVKPYGRDPKNLDKDSYILRKGHLTLCTTKGAKGYDAYIVFLVGTDQFANTREGRASFYVGATRAKMALYVTGQEKAGSLLGETMEVQQLLFAPKYR
jgi:hypothetical protein